MENLKSLYIDVPFNYRTVEVDDFVVTIGIKGHTNSVYHVAEVKIKSLPKKRMTRYYIKCYKSDLITCCSRDKKTQKVIDMQWYSRNKKN